MADETELNMTSCWENLRDVLQRKGALRALEALAPGLSGGDLRELLSAADGLDDIVRGQTRDLYHCVNGFRDDQWTRLLPDVDLLSVQQMIETRRMMLEVAPAEPGYAEDAGEAVYGFIPEFVPIAERDGYLLVADLREGEQSGTIISYDKVDADDGADTWPSLSHVLIELTAAIESTGTFRGAVPTIEDGKIRWA